MRKLLNILGLFRTFGHPKAKLSPYYPVYQISELSFSNVCTCASVVAMWCRGSCACFKSVCTRRSMRCAVLELWFVLDSISQMLSVKYQDF